MIGNPYALFLRLVKTVDVRIPTEYELRFLQELIIPYCGNIHVSNGVVSFERGDCFCRLLFHVNGTFSVFVGKIRTNPTGITELREFIHRPYRELLGIVTIIVCDFDAIMV